jgi:hypothetical protein
VLGRLRDGVDALAITRDGEEDGRRWEIAIPDVVPDVLKMPDAFSSRRVEGQQRLANRSSPTRFAP